jgi:uncharacterized protein YjbI with pentapeptide repeats
LTNAILKGAYAFHAQFSEATIDGADFTNTFLRKDTQKELWDKAQGQNPTTGNNTRETLSCE